MNTKSQTLCKVKKQKVAVLHFLLCKVSAGISVQVYSLGQVQTKVEKKNERDEFLVFFVKDSWRDGKGDVEDDDAN